MSSGGSFHSSSGAPRSIERPQRFDSALYGLSAVKVGTWITHTLFFGYREHINARPDENTGEGELEYWIARRLMLQGTIGDRGYDGADLLWRRRW